MVLTFLLIVAQGISISGVDISTINIGHSNAVVDFLMLYGDFYL